MKNKKNKQEKKKNNKIKNNNKVKNNTLKNFIKNNKDILILFSISILILIAASFVLGFILSFIIVAIIDTIIWLILHRKKKKGKKKTSILQIILIFVFSFGILSLLAISGFFIYIANTAPEFNPSLLEQKEASILYDANGEIFRKIGREIREKVTYDELPQVLIDAIIATEDSRFFQHNGFDLPRFVKASFGQILGNSGAGGASTLTMQLSKNIYTSTEDEGIEGIIRKFTDIYMSIFKIEKNYTKQEILEFYVNYNYLGAASRGGAYGVEQACQVYFGKSAKDINLAEASLIAGLFNAPNALDPLKYPERAEERRSTVLYLMELHGYISNEERQIAESISVESLLTKDYHTESYQDFVDTVVAEIIDKTKNDPYVVPMEIYTTMDPKKQAHIDSVMKGDNFKWENEAVQAGIAVLNTKTGAILAVGANREEGGEKNYNYATMIKKQIGSTAKPLYDYGPAIEYNNWSTYTLFADEPFSYTNGPDINNWDGKFQGLITMRTALIGSRNIPALKTFKKIENNKIKTFVTNLGLSPEIESNKVHEAHSIGGYNGESPLSVAAAYAAFGNKGVYNEPYSFTKLIYRDTKEVYENKTTTKKVMSEDTAYMITHMLIDTAPSAIGAYNAKINNATIAAKTGTTNFPIETWSNYKNLANTAINDLWVAGYDPDYTMAVWYGYDKLNQEYVDNGYYTKLPTNAHSNLFNKAGKGIFTKSTKFAQPNNVISVTVEKDTYPAQLPSEHTPDDMKITELFKEGTEPTEISNRYKKLDDVQNLTSNIEGNKLTLIWEGIKTPDAIDEEKIKSYYKPLYSTDEYLNKKVEERLNYNKDKIGTVIYNVYYKDENGELQLLESTENTTIDIDVTGIGRPITYVVKASYTIFKDNESVGIELTVDLTNVGNLITAILNGSDNVTLNVGDIYNEPIQPIIVTSNLIDVTNQAIIEKTIKDKDNNPVANISTENENTYTVTYKINYNDFSETIIQTIQVVQNTVTPEQQEKSEDDSIETQ